MKLHRALILVLMTILAVALLATMLAGAIGSWDARSGVALLVVLVAAVLGGIAFSWRRYFGKKT